MIRRPAPKRQLSTIKLSIDAEGNVYLDTEPITDDQLRARFSAAAKASPIPEVHVRADKATRYERVAFVMSSAQQAGLTKIGFVTEPLGTPAEAPVQR